VHADVVRDGGEGERGEAARDTGGDRREARPTVGLTLGGDDRATDRQRRLQPEADAGDREADEHRHG